MTEVNRMKLAAIGDIHSNHIALEACIRWVRRHDIDGIVFLGDYVTDCPYPQKTVDILQAVSKEYKCFFIRGNREDYLLKHRASPSGWKQGSRSGALLYTYNSLDGAALDWFSQMPVELDIFGSIHTVHVPPYHTPRQKQPPEELLEAAVQGMTSSVLLCAHSHYPLVYRQDGRLIVNCGSLGVPNGETGAFFAVLEYTDRWDAEIIHLDYDIEAVCGGFGESGMLNMSGMWGLGTMKMLRTGREYAVDCSDEVARLLALYPDRTENEELWTEAARNIGLIT
ncbi:MAG: metallophosphoesterase family protein [Oscillospiraceae bacterium]|nr:metallophosphoesterase family protein [Oscillospiraceae bacterium]